MSFRIITDTSANLPTDWLAANEIRVVPFSYSVNEKEAHCDDTRKFRGTKFYEAMRKGARVETSQISPQRYLDDFLPPAKQGEAILYIGMSSGISGSYHCAELAAEELREQVPDCRIELVDTLGASLGEGLLVLRAVEARRAGVSLEETAERLRTLRHRICQVFTVDDLAYLRRGGRLSNVAAVVGTVLRIKPLLKGNERGEIVSFSRCRGRRTSIEALAAHYDAHVQDPQTQTVGIAHADCAEDAALLAGLLNRNHPPKEILTVCYEPVTGSHVGTGTLALFFEAHEGVREI